MSEPSDHDATVEEPAAQTEAPEASPAPGPGTTGHPAVDEVLRSLEGLDGRPVDEHVAAFEHAHDVLRRALSHAGDDTVDAED